MSEQETVKNDLEESLEVINELVLLASERIIPGQLGYPIKILWDALKNLEYNERLLVKIIFGEPISNPAYISVLSSPEKLLSGS